MISRLTDGALCLGLILASGCKCALAQYPMTDRTDAGREQITLKAVTGVHLLSTQPADTKSIQQSAGLLLRIGRFYLTDWSGTPSASESVARRGLDAPMDSPPFPSSDWGYGGSPTIGVPDANVYPTMSVLKQEGSRTRLYGWVEVSGNASTSSDTNYPITYGFVSNRVVLNQAVLALERQPDTTKTSQFDWGFHLSGLFGTDYRFTTANGYLSQQLLTYNRQYGFDPLWESLDLYFPVKEGFVIRIGRFLAVPGIETQLAPSNYALSHSLVYSAAPSTETGAIYFLARILGTLVSQSNCSPRGLVQIQVKKVLICKCRAFCSAVLNRVGRSH